MSFFPRSFVSEPTSSFTPLFRLLDDYDTYNSDSNKSHNHNNHTRNNIMKTFNPKFDVRELDDVYELHGELPGVEQKDIEIEFVDAQTISVKGRVERTHQSGTPPAAVEAPKSAGAIEDNASKTENNTEKSEDNTHKAKVEDEDAATATEATSTEVAKSEDKPVAETPKHKEPEAKYWISERSVGEFSRTFTFPIRVDQEGVKASMKNGILSVTVPKAKKPESRKITIS